MRLLLASLILLSASGQPPSSEYNRRVHAVTRTPGFVALWDFVKMREGRFAAHQPDGDSTDLLLDASNYVRDYWSEGRPAGYGDFPMLGRGPFGQAVQFRQESDQDFRPVLLVPRARFHGSRLDVKGPGRSVSMVAWVIHETGNHAIAGIWHEGTDLRQAAGPARKVERGRRQYALFAGLAANAGGSAVHVSENGGASFGDKYARNLAVTPELLPAVAADAPPGVLDKAWTAVGFVFDNRANTVTAYINGAATEYWIDDPARHPFFQWPAKAWLQAQAHGDPAFHSDQFYQPPESKPRSRKVVSETSTQRVELQRFPFTRVRVTLVREAPGKPWTVSTRELAALRVNPFYFPHDLFTPPSASDGGPFTIGRVIHSSRSVGFTGYIGGVAVFDRALARSQMRKLAAIAAAGPIPLPR
jgi:hypothetical protein